MTDRSFRETSDAAEVEEWAERRDLVPVRRADTSELVLVDEERAASDDGVDRLAWDEFATAFERRDATFRVRVGDADPAGTEAGDGDGVTDVDDAAFVEADDAGDGAVGRSTETEETLEEGQTARAEVTETRTVEDEVVTTATVETEVVDAEEIDEEVIDVELLDRELDGCTVDEDGEYVEADLRERKLYTTEVRKRDLVESRVVDADADVEETDAAADAAAVDRTVETEGESALVDDEAVERGLEETRVRDRERADAAADAVADEVELDERIERRLVETEVVSRDRVRARITERDRVDAEVVSEAITETELLDATEATDAAETSEASDEGEGTERGETRDADPLNETVWVDDSHEGDAVVDADGETVGRVTGVDGLAIRVESTDADGETTIRQDQVEEVRDGVIGVAGVEWD